MKTVKNVKKEAVNALNQIMLSPFAVINAINRNRKEAAVSEILTKYGVSGKIGLAHLLTVQDGERDIVCKLQEVKAPEYLDGNELKVVKIGSKLYEYVPIKFTVSEFFSSLSSVERLGRLKEKALKREKEAVIEHMRLVGNAILRSIPEISREKAAEYAAQIVLG